MRPEIRLFIAALTVFLCSLAPLAGQEKGKPTPVAANNAAQLKRLIGKDVTVRGKVSRTSKSKSGHHFLNFASSELTVICFQEDVAKFGKRGPAEVFREKNVEVTGKLELHRGKPQIKLRQPAQIRLVQAPQPAGEQKPESTTTAVEFKLKQIGKDAWLSPAGLRYVGRDPEGLTRVDHVLRHAKDMPNRAGPHGVFDGGEDRALSTLDEAWKLAKSKGIKPQQESGRSSYLVPMGRRIGYLGGKTGKAQGNPPLDRIFIVVRSGTSEVVTAYPK